MLAPNEEVGALSQQCEGYSLGNAPLSREALPNV